MSLSNFNNHWCIFRQESDLSTEKVKPTQSVLKTYELSCHTDAGMVTENIDKIAMALQSLN